MSARFNIVMPGLKIVRLKNLASNKLAYVVLIS